MSEFYDDLVLLNKVMLKSAKEQLDVAKSMGSPMSRGSLDQLTARVGTEIISGEKRYEMTTSTDSKSWTLNLTFDLGQTLSVLPMLVLSYKLADDTSRQVIFTEVSQGSSNTEFKASLKLTELDQRDQLLRALSVVESETNLVVSAQVGTRKQNVITDPDQFYFPQAFYPYIYQGLLPPVPVQGYIQRPVVYNGHYHNYYQDNITKDIFYFLPDSYQLAVDPSTKQPLISIYFTALPNATELTQTNATFQYVLKPKTDSARIQAAKKELDKIHAGARLIPLNTASKTELKIDLPGENGAIKSEEQSNATIDLQGLIRGSFTVPTKEFQSIWDALFNPSEVNLVMKGNLTVTIGKFNPDHVPVKFLMDTKFKTQIGKFITRKNASFLKETLTFKSNPVAYKADGPKPIYSMTITVGTESIELNKATPNKQLIAEVPVFDVLAANNQNAKDADQKIYKYDLLVMYADGSAKQYPTQSTDQTIIFVPPAV